MFSTDRDLQALEPAVFRDVVWVSQRLASGVATVSGTTLTATSQDVDFETAGVGAGRVVTLGTLALEVLSRVSGTELEVSRMRGSVSGAAVAVGSMGAQSFEVPTFDPQRGVVHGELVRGFGLDDGTGAGVSDVTNASQLALLEALSTLHLVYAGASAGNGSHGSGMDVMDKARAYRARAMSERVRAVARVDLDGDGVWDEERRLGVGLMRRA